MRQVPEEIIQAYMDSIRTLISIARGEGWTEDQTIEAMRIQMARRGYTEDEIEENVGNVRLMWSVTE